MKKMIALNSVCVDVFVEKNEIHPGGEALNFCGNVCQKENVSCYLMGAIGDDEYGKEILHKLAGYPIHLDYLRVDEGRTANHKIHLTKDGDRYFKEGAWDGGVYEKYCLNDSEIEFMLSADSVHACVTSPIFEDVLDVRKKGKFLLSVDFDDLREFDLWEKYLPWIDVFFISGCEEILPQLESWSKRYESVFVATLAEEGSVAYKQGKCYQTKAIPVDEVIDTTGCGDSYQAGFMWSYCQNGDIAQAMIEGSRQAFKTLSHLGGF